MTFTEEIRLLRHYKKAHQTKPEHYKQKWYWDNSQSENENQTFNFNFGKLL